MSERSSEPDRAYVVTDADGMTTAELLAEWRDAAATELAALAAYAVAPSSTDAPLEAYTAAASASKEMARRAWSRPLDQDGVRWRAEIVRHCLWLGYRGEPEGTRRFEKVLEAEPKTPGALEVNGFDERAVAELVKAVLWTAPSAAPMPTTVPGPALVWRAILGMRGHRDAIEIATDRLTGALDVLARRTGLMAAIEAGWDPEGDLPVIQAAANGVTAPESSADTRQVAWGDVQDRVSRAKAGLATLRTLWNSHAAAPADADAFFAFGASMEFVTDSIESLLDEIAHEARGASNRRGNGLGAPPS